MTTQEKTNEAIELLKQKGMTNFIVSKSSTNFGNSNYIKFYSSCFRNIFTVRISDHSVGQRRRFDEVCLDSFIADIEKYNNIYKSWN